MLRSSPPPPPPSQSLCVGKKRKERKMLAAKSPPRSDSQIQRPKSSRRALQPKNTAATPKPKLDTDWFEISLFHNSNKENIHPINNDSTTPASGKAKIEPLNIESFDASLAQELNSIRKKLERLKADKDKTDKMLKDRDLILDIHLKDLETRGQVQKHLEIQVDRLYRLKELRLSCMRISPIRSLREKEQEKKMKQEDREAKEISTEDRTGMRNQTPSQSPDSDVDKEGN